VKTSRKFVAAPTTRGRRLLVLSVFGLGAILPGCAEKEGIIPEIKPQPAASGSSPDAPQRGPKRAGAGAVK
jgi:hypothetical protein